MRNALVERKTAFNKVNMPVSYLTEEDIRQLTQSYWSAKEGISAPAFRHSDAIIRLRKTGNPKAQRIT